MHHTMCIMHLMEPFDRELNSRVTVTLTREQRTAVTRIARASGTSEAAVVRSALNMGLPEHCENDDDLQPLEAVQLTPPKFRRLAELSGTLAMHCEQMAERADKMGLDELAGIYRDQADEHAKTGGTMKRKAKQAEATGL